MGITTKSDLQPKGHTENEKEVLHDEKHEFKKKKHAKYLKQAICILAAAGVITTVSVLNVNAFKLQFPNVIKHNVFSSDYKDDDISIAYIPKGFELAENSNSDKGVYRSFKNGEMWFDVSRAQIEDEYEINMENMEFKRLKIKGNDAFLFTKPSLTILFWNDNENTYMFHSNLSREEVLKIGKSTV